MKENTSWLPTIEAAYLEITTRCNLNCASCYNAVSRAKNPREMDLPQIRQCIEALIPYGCKKIVLSGGEPTLHSRFAELPALAEEFSELEWVLVTNGTTPWAPLEKLFSGKASWSVQLSLDGSCEEVNAKTRGSGVFAPAWETLKRLSALAKKCSCMMVLSKRNLGDLSGFYQKMAALGVTPVFSFLLPLGNGEQGFDEAALSPRQQLDVVRQLSFLNRQYGLDSKLPLCSFGCPYDADPEQLAPLFVLVKPDGSVQPCQSLYDSSCCLGNLLAPDSAGLVREILRFSQTVRSRRELDCPPSCIARAGCRKGCPAMALLHSGSLTDKDGNCEFRRLETAWLLSGGLQREEA